jgi:hypothetical protein
MRDMAAQVRDDTYEPGARTVLRQLLGSNSEATRLAAARALLIAPPEDEVAEDGGGGTLRVYLNDEEYVAPAEATA